MQLFQRTPRKPTVIIVTMIDVFSVLLIFFVAATTFKKTLPAVKISLPEAKSGAPLSQTEPLILSITPDEKIYLNAKELSVSQLRNALQEMGKQNPQPTLAMQADKKASFGLVIKVMDAAKAAGFTQLPAFIDQEGPAR
ncbi:MAG: biopolymer transporter ExbD [Verrucomicrobiae bacterium]|nr:biopolymer transporter ExbD [Verrucomicrobiae bacterium]